MKHLQLIVIGISLGWLIGMSESPVIASVITSLLSVLVILLTALSGLKNNSETDHQGSTTLSKLVTNGISTLPVMLVLLGIVLGAILGVCTRTHDWLSPNEDDGSLKISVENIPARPYGIDVDALVAKYSKYGIPDSVIAARALNIELPADPAKFNENSPLGIQLVKENSAKPRELLPAHKKSVLYSLNSDECASLCAYVGVKFMKKLEGYSEDDKNLQKLMNDYASNPEKLEKRIKEQCKCGN